MLAGAILVWQVDAFSAQPQTPAPVMPAAGAPASGVASTVQMHPKPAEVPAGVPMTDREKALMALQQETQVKYLEKLNELQLLKVERDIASTSKDISTNNLAKVEADKKTIDLLSGGSTVPGPVGAPGVATVPGTTVTTTSATPPPFLQEVSYSLVSITEVQSRWAAVLSYKGSLFNVHVGDVLPPDGSTVVAIAKESVTLQQKGGERKRLSLVTII